MLGLGLGLTNFGTRGGVSDVPDALSGASSMLDGEDGLAIDFSDQSIAIRDTTTPANNIASAGTVRNSALVGPGAKITYTSPSPKLCKKADGTYGYRAQNLYLNSEAPANQSITVVSDLPYIITVTGTVSITLSGAATGTVTAGNPITFTAATGTLTCGSTSGAGTVHLRSTIAAPDYIKTTSAPLYDLPYDWTGTYYYPLCEPAATNLGTFSRTWPVHANYSSTNITRTQVTGFDGEANSTYAFEATGANAWVNCHSLDNNVLDTTYTRSLFVKRLTGSGPVYIAPNGLYGWKGSGSETVTGSNKITNGDFPSNVTGWTITGTPDASNYFTWNAGGYADFASNGGIMVTQGTSGLTPGKVYRYAVTVTIASGVLRFSNGSNGLQISTSGTYYILVMASGTTDSGPAFARVSGNLVCTIDDVVVREVTGIDLDVSGQLVTGEWRRVSVPPYVAHGGASARRILIATSGDKIAVDQHQIETGIVATSPIITAGATVTRAEDNLSMLTSAFPWNAAAVTMFVEGDTAVANLAADRAFLQLSDGTNNNRLIQHAVATTNVKNFFVAVGGATQANVNSGATVAANTPHKFAASAAENDFRCSIDGVLGTPDTSGSMPTGITTLHLGRSATGHHLRGHIRKVMVLPRTSTNAERQALTA